MGVISEGCRNVDWYFMFPVRHGLCLLKNNVFSFVIACVEMGGEGGGGGGGDLYPPTTFEEDADCIVFELEFIAFSGEGDDVILTVVNF
jgi:hypothetical protein